MSTLLDSIGEVLSAGGFMVDPRELPGLGTTLVAETPHALVLCFACTWETLEDSAEEAQAMLTNLAAEHPSPLRWDLYVVAAIERPANQAEEVLRERLEHDTRYARKFVLAGHSASLEAVERALRPLLPLRVPPSVHLSDPLEAVRTELLNAGASPNTVDKALAAFRATGEVKVQ